MSIGKDNFYCETDRFVNDMMMAERAAAFRRHFPFGREYSDQATKFLVPIPENNTLEIPISSERCTEKQIIDLAVHLRNMVEWPIWSDQTAFPAVRDQAGPGKPIGQCLVTSRLAKNYFWHANLVEVKVINREGLIVGPHVVLEIPVLDPDNKVEQYYLDLTHDQSLAIGPIPRYSIDISPRTKINLVKKNSLESPYIFVRYQTDEELKGKASQPLRHSELVLEMVAYRHAYERIQGPERYAVPIDILAESSLLFEEFGYDDIKILRSAFLCTLENNSSQPGSSFDAPTIKFGIIKQQEFLPSPDWIWKVSSLRGYNVSALS